TSKRFSIRSRERLNAKLALSAESNATGRQESSLRLARSNQAIAICGCRQSRVVQTALAPHRATCISRASKRSSVWPPATESFPFRLRSIYAQRNAKNQFD